MSDLLAGRDHDKVAGVPSRTLTRQTRDVAKSTSLVRNHVPTTNAACEEMGPFLTHGSRHRGNSFSRTIGNHMFWTPGTRPHSQEVVMSLRARDIGPLIACLARSASARYWPRYEEADM